MTNERSSGLNPRRRKARDQPLAAMIRESLQRRRASPAELARELGESVSTVAYHCLKLEPPQAGAER